MAPRARRITKFCIKSLAGLVLVLSVVGPMSYAAHGTQTFVLGTTAGLTNWFLSILYTKWEQLDQQLDAVFGKAIVGSIFVGMTTGFGVGLGLEVSETVNVSIESTIVEAIVKWLTIGLALGVSAGIFLRVGEFLAGTLVLSPEKISLQHYEGKVGRLVYIVMQIIRLSFLFIGFGVPFGVAEASGGGVWAGLVTGIIAGLFVWLALALLIAIGVNPAALPWALFYSFAIGILVALVSGIFVGIGIGSGTGLVGFAAANLSGGCGLLLGGVVGLYLGNRGRPLLNIFEGLLPYLRVMAIPVSSFATGYLLIAALFAGFYSSVYQLDPEGNFSNLPLNPHIGDFFYFSAMTMLSLSYSEIETSSQVTKLLASAEAIVGIGWIVVIFAAVVAYLQPRFAEIYSQAPITKDEKLARARSWAHEILTERNLYLIDKIASSNVQKTSGNEDLKKMRDPEAIKDTVIALYDAIPEISITLNSQQAESFHGTSTRWTGQGIHRQQFRRLTPTGDRVNVSGRIDFDIEPTGEVTDIDLVIESWSPQQEKQYEQCGSA